MVNYEKEFSKEIEAEKQRLIELYKKMAKDFYIKAKAENLSIEYNSKHKTKYYFRRNDCIVITSKKFLDYLIEHHYIYFIKEYTENTSTDKNGQSYIYKTLAFCGYKLA